MLIATKAWRAQAYPACARVLGPVELGHRHGQHFQGQWQLCQRALTGLQPASLAPRAIILDVVQAREAPGPTGRVSTVLGEGPASGRSLAVSESPRA